MNLFMFQTLGVVAVLVSTAAPRSGSEEDLRRPLAECVQSEAEKLDFSGIVSIARPEGTISYARGVLDKSGSPKIGADTRFNLASAGKMFTAVAVAQLLDSGKVRLDEPIGDHVRGLTPEASKVTIRQLLNHSSGLGNFFSPDNLKAIKHARSVSELLPLVASETPSFTPGSQFQYSSTGFLILGLLVEKVTGLSYDRYLNQHVFAPAGMVASGLDPGLVPKQAVGMTTSPRRKGPLRPAPEAALRGNPAGGAFSTASDMQRFFAALLAGWLTSPAMLKELTSPQMMAAPAKGDSPQVSYGFGFGVGVFHGHRWFGHNGGAPGANTETAAYPDDLSTIVVMSNRDPPTATLLFRKLRELLFDPDLLKSCASNAASTR
jgi:CubicO group peptidase (beta-lactamase class C family)